MKKFLAGFAIVVCAGISAEGNSNVCSILSHHVTQENLRTNVAYDLPIGPHGIVAYDEPIGPHGIYNARA